MAVVTVYQHGFKAGIPPEPSNHERARRRRVEGWSAKSTRSNLEFLRSVVLEDLFGLGHCLTLTVKTCPASAKVWNAMRDEYIRRLRRGGLLRLHWVTEWQSRGVPHLHGVAYFREPESDREYAQQHRLCTSAWLAVVQEYQAEELSQCVKPIGDAVGWLKYLAKHAARGASHYQRSAEGIPASWQGKTGRMWGRVGQWPVQPGQKMDLDRAGYFVFRRIVQRWRLADARAAKDAGRIKSARKMLQSPVRSLAEVRGVSEWMPEEFQLSMLAWIAGQGHLVIKRAEKTEEEKAQGNVHKQFRLAREATRQQRSPLLDAVAKLCAARG